MIRGFCEKCAEFSLLSKHHVFHKEQGGVKSPIKWLCRDHSRQQDCHAAVESFGKKLACEFLSTGVNAITAGTSGSAFVGDDELSFEGATTSGIITISPRALDFRLYTMDGRQLTTGEVVVVDAYTLSTSASVVYFLTKN